MQPSEEEAQWTHFSSCVVLLKRLAIMSYILLPTSDSLRSTIYVLCPIFYAILKGCKGQVQYVCQHLYRQMEVKQSHNHLVVLYKQYNDVIHTGTCCWFSHHPRSLSFSSSFSQFVLEPQGSHIGQVKHKLMHILHHRRSSKASPGVT